MIKGLLRLALSGVAFLAGLSACAGVLAHFFPLWREVSIVRAKVRQIADHPAAYDTLFIGTSRVYRHADPATFDEVTAAAGRPTHSFNCGIDGMFPPEDRFMAEQLFSFKPRGLRHVFLEIGTFLPLAQANALSARAVAWHDLPRTWFVLRELFPTREWERAAQRRKKKQPGGDRLPVLMTGWTRIQPHLDCCLRNVTNLGHGHELLQPRLVLGPDSRQRDDDQVLGPGGAGFNGLTAAPDPAQLKEFETHLEERQTAPVSERTLDPLEEDNLEAIVKLIRAAGAEPVLLIAPNPVPLKHFPSRPLGIPVLDFTDFRRWPELFDLKNRQDYGHLNRAGAEIYTRYLAQEWLKLEQHEPAAAAR